MFYKKISLVVLPEPFGTFKNLLRPSEIIRDSYQQSEKSWSLPNKHLKIFINTLKIFLSNKIHLCNYVKIVALPC